MARQIEFCCPRKIKKILDATRQAALILLVRLQLGHPRPSFLVPLSSSPSLPFLPLRLPLLRRSPSSLEFAEHGLNGESLLTCHSQTPKFCSGTEKYLLNLSISTLSMIKTAPNNPPLPLLLPPPSVVCPSNTSRMSFPFVIVTRTPAAALGHSRSFQPLFAVFTHRF